ncbi:AAC(3) family N-acetyltransferase [Vibrio coralliilyticus]|uniref:AAC(3) family N-acetyltransferase n=1 Tax=Vibrio coralliilyticus TaxID=190893 RepID=UPI00155FFC29|nr:AAC(3) family N-acetyltransferase [Vibrio coralliilyticus]NRF64531.1 AAC(3) family N-acetyltransferase [Vibrio coralliilyticus]
MRRKVFTVEELENGFRSLGIVSGDVVLIRASLGKVGRIEKPSKENFLRALINVVGDEGTVVTLGFSKSYFFGRGAKAENHVFKHDTPPNIGALSNVALFYEGAQRSKHPCNSFIAIGKNAQEILDGHDANALSYQPMEKLVSLNAKMLLVGCISDSPGFTTVHLAQEKLGLTKRSLLSGLMKVCYRDGDQLKTFSRRDFGGCSRGFSKFYEHYLAHGLLTAGKVGNADSIMVKAAEAFELEYSLIRNNPKFPFCDNPLCMTCRATWKFNVGEIPGFLCRKIARSIVNRWKRS